MSAWDIAGAVVWMPLAAFFWFAFWTAQKESHHVAAILIATSSTLGAIFCIARLFGAHA